MDSFFASNLFIILKFFNVILVAGLIIVSLYKLQSRPQKITFTMMLLFFLLSTLFFNHTGALNDWLKHILFYIGQFFFYLFLYYLIRFYFRKKEQKESSQHEHADATQTPAAGDEARIKQPSIPSTMAAGFGISTIDWFAFLTEQGLQHILVLPIFFLIVIIVRVQYLSIESAHFKQALNLFLWAGLNLMMIHTGEFFIENQNFIPFLTDKIETIEFLLFYLGILFLNLGMKKLSDPAR